MGIFDKLSNIIYEDTSKKEEDKKKKGSWTDIFYEDASKKEEKKQKGSWTDIFYEDTTKKEEKKKRNWTDIFYEQPSDDNIKSTFVDEEEKTSVLDDILSQIERRESELTNLGEFFKTINPKDYPDSAPEYEAYLSLVKQLEEIKKLGNVNSNSAISSMSDYQLESEFKKFELDYNTHINAIKSICYLSEISTLNTEMENIFSNNFTEQTHRRITQIDGYITLISKKSDRFDKKYSTRIYKELIESEYRITLLKLMDEIKHKEEIRRNPFDSFSSQKKKTFETYLSKGIRDTNSKYNRIADNRKKYTKYKLIKDEYFDELDAEAEVISERINEYTIDDFLLGELLDNGEGFETLKRFLKFKLALNFVDSKTSEADKRFLDEQYRKAVFSGHTASDDFNDDFSER